MIIYDFICYICLYMTIYGISGKYDYIDYISLYMLQICYYINICRLIFSIDR